MREEEAAAGRPAEFWTQTIPAPALAAGAVTRTLAFWEQGELLINVNAAGLTRAEIAQVLASLAELIAPP